MKRETQASQNPFINSSNNKRYYTFDYYMKNRFGGKCARIAIDAGFSCPNKDGTKGFGGCIFCYSGSSGAACKGDIEKQYKEGVDRITKKWSCTRFIPYLQANTNTYASIETLSKIYEACAVLPGAVMLAIATRADCLSPEVLLLLGKISKKIPLIVELGLQSVHDKTAALINRGHTFAQFTEAYNRLYSMGGDISICVHLINGLPGETTEMMLESADTVAKMKPHMIKIHSLHILRETVLYNLYTTGKYVPMEREDYISTVCSQLELMSPDTVIARLTGDAPDDILAAPLWCRQKVTVINDIDKELFRRNSYQGISYTTCSFMEHLQN